MNIVDPQTVAAIKALGNSQVKVLTGTVTSTPTNAQTTPVRLDNDQAGNGLVEPILIPSICGLITQGTRVTIFTVPPAGMVIIGVIGADYNLDIAADQAAEAYADLALRESSQVWMNPLVYTTNDTWNKPTSSLFLGVTVKIQAGGGGSGGTGLTTANATRNSSSAGGQGGGYVEILVLSASLTPTVAVTVGSGGAAGASPSGNGGAGGASSFAAYGSIPGGAGGAGGGVLGGVAVHQTTQTGGTGVQTATVGGGAVLIDYQQGDDGGQGFRWGGAVDNAVIWPGFGGGSRMSGITRVGTMVDASTNPQIGPIAGWPFGGGASGRASGPGVAAAGGSAGAQGLVIVNEWYRR